MKTKRNSRKKAKEDEERLALINKYTNDYSAQVIDALENNGLPKTPIQLNEWRIICTNLYNVDTI